MIHFLKEVLKFIVVMIITLYVLVFSIAYYNDYKKEQSLTYVGVYHEVNY